MLNLKNIKSNFVFNVVLAFALVISSFTPVFATSGNEYTLVEQLTVEQLEFNRALALESVKEQLIQQDAERYFDLAAKDINEIYDAEINKFKNPIQASSASGTVYAPDGGSVSTKSYYVNSVAVYMNRKQSKDYRNGRQDLLAIIASGLAIPIGIKFTSIGAVLSIISWSYSLNSYTMDQIINDGGCLVLKANETTTNDPEGAGKTFTYFYQWPNPYEMNIDGSYDYIIY